MNSEAKAGFIYQMEFYDPAGNLEHQEAAHNLIPIEGINHLLDTEYNAGAQVAQWYIGLFGGAYAPQPTDTAATLPALAGEVTNYEGTTREAFACAPAAAGIVTNSANKAEFVFTSNGTVTGGFISSAPTKGSTAGVLGSVVALASPKTVSAGSTLRVTATNQIAST